MSLGGGRTLWVHPELTRINKTPTILPTKFEDLREAGATLLNAWTFIARSGDLSATSFSLQTEKWIPSL